MSKYDFHESIENAREFSSCSHEPFIESFDNGFKHHAYISCKECGIEHLNEEEKNAVNNISNFLQKTLRYCEIPLDSCDDYIKIIRDKFDDNKYQHYASDIRYSRFPGENYGYIDPDKVYHTYSVHSKKDNYILNARWSKRLCENAEINISIKRDSDYANPKCSYDRPPSYMFIYEE